MKKPTFFGGKQTVSTPVQTAPARTASVWGGMGSISPGEIRRYRAVREAVPIVDAAIQKLVRLAGGFDVLCSDTNAQPLVQEFLDNVKVSGGGVSINCFIERYLDCMLTCGTAVGEIVLTKGKGSVAGLYLANLDDLEIREGEDPFNPQILVKANNGELIAPPMPSLILTSSLAPLPGESRGRSILSGMPFFADVLTTIFKSVGQNFERMGNLRYAVTYKPPEDRALSAYNDDIAKTIAHEWADGMNSQKAGIIKDFVAVGDVSVKVIGADGQALDMQVPVRCILEQLIAKLGIPPFMLGLSWSTTERMSSQQADILTSELEAYRRYLTPVIIRILRIWAGLSGICSEFVVKWHDINLQDEVELARAELLRAQAKNTAKG